MRDLSSITDTLTLIDYLIKGGKWMKKHPKETQKYSSLTLSFLMLVSSFLFLILAACSFYLKAIETQNLQTAFLVFFMCIGFTVKAFLFARYHFIEFKKY